MTWQDEVKGEKVGRRGPPLLCTTMFARIHQTLQVTPRYGSGGGRSCMELGGNRDFSLFKLTH